MNNKTIKLAHLADTHIRNLKYHFEYREAFADLYKQLKESKPDYIVHCGDLAHTKTQLSPEYFSLATEFLSNLANIAPTIIIAGNHDGNLKNTTREDAINPIVGALKHPNLHFLKDAGEFSLDDKITFNVLSVFDEENWMQPTDDSKINIALYHGAISNCQTDLGYVMEFGEHEAGIFKNFDYALLGDIHKKQFLNKTGTIAYCGSTVQQNFGEDVDKGYLMWHINDKTDFKVKFHKLNNPRPFVNVVLTKTGQLPKVDVPVGCRLRLIGSNLIPPIKMKRAMDFAKVKWRPTSVSFSVKTGYKGNEKTNLSDALKKENLRDITVQEKYIRKYLKDMELDDGIMDKVLELNRKYNHIVEENEEVTRNVIWKLKSATWDNLFNYGEKNTINFDRLNGIVGIFGKNYSGKSSIIDSVLYGLYNTTSKNERKNVHIINQNKQDAKILLEIESDNATYKIARNLNKYTRKLKGKETIEAKVDLDFTKEIGGVDESLNGTTRNETDANIRRKFGTIDDFLLTSMASQLDSLSFIKEGSTKRKEIIAKFLDLDIFDQKFKLAKKDSADIKTLIKKFEAKNYLDDITKNQELLEEIVEAIENKKKECQKTTKSIESFTGKLKEVEDIISSIPAEIIDIDKVKAEILSKEEDVKRIIHENIDLQKEISNNEEFTEQYKMILDDLNYEQLISLSETCKTHKERKSIITLKLNQQTKILENLKSKVKLLEEHQYDPNCKYCVSNQFVKDAHEASTRIMPTTKMIEELQEFVSDIQEKINFINPEVIASNIERHNKFSQDIDQLQNQNEIKSMELSSNKDKLNLLKNQIESLRNQEAEYEENREAIENLGTLTREKKALETKLSQLRQVYTKCNEQLQECLIEQGSTAQIIKNIEKELEEYKGYENKWVAYEMFMRCMHANGISYNIIKDRLPIINEEIGKVLANIVDFEVFFDNTDSKLDIFIKHPMYDPRPLSMASGAEKTLASMAIRLGMISITNLPVGNLFVLDEPATALDAEHMEGFVRLLEMVKTQFKIVLLVSHLESLKDVVDMTIDIDKIDGYANVVLK